MLQWTPLLKTYCIMSETTAVSTLFLSGFFWAFLSGGPVIPYHPMPLTKGDDGACTCRLPLRLLFQMHVGAHTLHASSQVARKDGMLSKSMGEVCNVLVVRSVCVCRVRTKLTIY